MFISHTVPDPFARRNPSRPPHNLFSVCRQIRYETRLLFFSNTSFALYRCDEAHHNTFKGWLASVGDDAVSILPEVALIDELTLSRNLRTFAIIDEINGLGSVRYKCKATLDLTVVPPAVAICIERQPSGEYIILNGIAASSAARTRSITSLTPPSRRLNVHARRLLAAAVAGKLEGLFGNCHSGCYSTKDLELIIGAFASSMHECFGKRRYWLRKRKRFD